MAGFVARHAAKPSIATKKSASYISTIARRDYVYRVFERQCEIGIANLEKIHRVVKMTGFVQAVPDFHQIPDVLNAASEIFAAVFGEKGTHARTAVGVGSLPLNAAVEIDIILELK